MLILRLKQKLDSKACMRANHDHSSVDAARTSFLPLSIGYAWIISSAETTANVGVPSFRKQLCGGPGVLV